MCRATRCQLDDGEGKFNRAWARILIMISSSFILFWMESFPQCMLYQMRRTRTRGQIGRVLTREKGGQRWDDEERTLAKPIPRRTGCCSNFISRWFAWFFFSFFFFSCSIVFVEFNETANPRIPSGCYSVLCVFIYIYILFNDKKGKRKTTLKREK